MSRYWSPSRRMLAFLYVLPAVIALLAAGLIFSNNKAVGDAETQQLTGFINQYRSQHGLTQLSNSLGASAQEIAQEVVDSCGYGPMFNNEYITFGSYGYPDAESLWAAWLKDPVYLDEFIEDPKYRSIGVGRAFSSGGCGINPMWVVQLSTKVLSGSPPEVGTPAPKPLLPGDVDCNGKVDTADVLKLLRFVGGLGVLQACAK